MAELEGDMVAELEGDGWLSWREMGCKLEGNGWLSWREMGG